MKVSIDHSGCTDPCNQDGVFLNTPICLHNTDVSDTGSNGKDWSPAHAGNTGYCLLVQESLQTNALVVQRRQLKYRVAVFYESQSKEFRGGEMRHD